MRNEFLCFHNFRLLQNIQIKESLVYNRRVMLALESSSAMFFKFNSWTSEFYFCIPRVKRNNIRELWRSK